MKNFISVFFFFFFSVNTYSLTWIQGTYTGDGLDNRAVSGLGFSPDVIIIKGAGATSAVIKMSSLAGTRNKLPA